MDTESDTVTDPYDDEPPIISFAPVPDEGAARNTSPERNFQPAPPWGGGTTFDAIMDIEPEEVSAVVLSAADEEDHHDSYSVAVSITHRPIIP